jgi:hypothetical protein
MHTAGSRTIFGFFAGSLTSGAALESDSAGRLGAGRLKNERMDESFIPEFGLISKVSEN